MDVNNIIERFKYVKVILCENQDEGIPEEDEYDYEKESMDNPNRSVSGIKNPNSKPFNDSIHNINNILSHNHKIEKVNFEKNNINTKCSDSKNLNQNSRPNKYNIVSENIIEKSNIKEERNSINFQKFNKKNYCLEDMKNKELKYVEKKDNKLSKSVNELESTQKIKNENIKDDYFFASKHAIENSNDDKLSEEDITICEINENLKTPNINMKTISNHFLNNKSHQTNQNNKNTENFNIKRKTIKFNDINSNDKQNRINDTINFIKYNSKNENNITINNIVNKSNSISVYNSNENIQNLLINENEKNHETIDTNINIINNNFENGNIEKIVFKNKDKLKTNELINNLTSKQNKNQYETSNCKNFNNLNDYNFKMSKNKNDELHPRDFYYSNINNINGAENEIYNNNLNKIKASSECLVSSRSKSVDPSINNNEIGIKKKVSLRQKETIIFNQEDIVDYLHFKEWRKKIKLFFDKLKELIFNFSAYLFTIDQSYSWIQKRFLKENLKRIKKSHKAKQITYYYYYYYSYLKKIKNY